ncbi:MAG: septum formation initiator family protein [Alphaproteobacteria bacterium]|nr:septum formation initiator family protein [Alphaproteobacteria bacterium]
MLREMRRRAKVLVAPVLGIAATFYFGYHLVEGDRGLRAWLGVTQELNSAKSELAAVTAERDALEHRVAHLRSDHVDPDLLDTQVRKTLDVVSPDEVVIMQQPDSGATKTAPAPR